MKSGITLLAFASFTLLATHIAGAQSTDRVVIGMTAFPSNMHPFISSQTIKNYVLSAARRAVTRFDQNGRTICQLCTEVPSLENGRAKVVDIPNGGKGMEVTFTLRADLKWGDGSPLTTKDIAFGAEAERLLFPAPGVKNVSILDDLSYVVNLDRIRYDFDRTRVC